MRRISKITAVRLIVKLYFLAAVAASFTHIIESARKLGLTGWEMWSTPFMIDGIAIIGMIMRSVSFSKATNVTGRKTQIAAGVISLVANVYAAHTIGGYIFGVGVVVLFLVAESLADKIEGVEADREAERKALASERARKAAATRKRNKTAAIRKRKAQVKVLKEMINA